MPRTPVVKPIKPTNIEGIEAIEPVIETPKSLKSKILSGNIDEINIIMRDCEGITSLEYEAHVIIEDATKKLLLLKKDHGY